MIIETGWVMSVLLVTTRLAGLLLLTPLMPFRQLPIHARFFFLLSLSAVIVSALDLSFQEPSLDGIVFSVIAEALNGLILSLSIYAVFASLSLAGFLIDSQMGLNSTSILNPQARVQEPLTGYFLNLLAVSIFFASGGHRLFFKGIAYSLKILPPGKLMLSTGLTPALAQFSNLFVTALMIASPVIFCLLLLDMASGIMTRNMPQLSIYFITLPIKIMLGLFLIYMSLTGIEPVLARMFDSIFVNWQGVLS